MKTLSLVLLAACASAPPPHPQPAGSRGLHANEHLEAAHQHDELARQATAFPEQRTDDGTGRVDQLLIGSPWRRTWDVEADHERLAAIHRSAAGQIQAEYEEACGQRSLAEVSVSPLQRYGIGGQPTADGVSLFLSPEAGPPDRLLADMRCHRAWMMLAPGDMETCPLDLAGIKVDATGDGNGITVNITIHDRALVPELQRRAAHELEMSGKQHAAHAAPR
jgi:hypothetical protein